MYSRTQKKSSTTLPYETFGQLLRRYRKRAGLAKQSDLAKLVGATQQTVSRWEQGLSRPRDKEIALLASALGAEKEIPDLLRAAGYSLPTKAGTPVDRVFPLASLPPDSFERFCATLVTYLYRSEGMQVARAGGPGHKQDGIDISATNGRRTLSFQCKRMEEFGPIKVAKVIEDHTFKADRKFLLLSRVATPQARAEIAKRADWELWDAEDLTRKVRSLSLVEQRDLVGTFFRGLRSELLGEAEPGPWLTFEDYFAPFLRRDGSFNHAWTLVGRETELARIGEAFKEEGTRLVSIVAPAGRGKTRLLLDALRAFIAARPFVTVRMLSGTESLTAKDFEALGDGQQLLVVDDAHERDDLAGLFRHCATTERCTVLMTLRRYGREALRMQAAYFALVGEGVVTVDLPEPSLADASALAKQALVECGGPVQMADALAQATFDSPLATVLGARILAEGETPLPLLGNNDAFRTQILARFQDVIAGEIASGADVDRMAGLLRVIALVQPIRSDDPDLLSLLNDVEKIGTSDATRLIKTSIEAGILFRRGARYRLSPDLLADSIIERSCISLERESSRYAEEVFDKARGDHLAHILINLGRLDWRQRDGDTRDSKLLDGLWKRLRWVNKYDNPYVEAAEAVAYYQPKQALLFAEKLIAEGHGANEHVCKLIRNASYNYVFLDEACRLLWKAALSEERDPRRSSHGLRILKELAQYSPNKPREFVEGVVKFAIEAIDAGVDEANGSNAFEILRGSLQPEVQVTSAVTSRTMTFSTYQASRSVMADVRKEALGKLVEWIADSKNLRRAFVAAQTLPEALRAPMAADASSRTSWMEERDQLIQELSDLSIKLESPVVLVRVGESVAQQAFYGTGKSQAGALGILKTLQRDRDTRLVRALMDSWGSNTWPIDSKSHERPDHEADRQALVKELNDSFKDVSGLCGYLARWLEEIGRVADGNERFPALFVNVLIDSNLSLAKAVVELEMGKDSGPMGKFGGAGLGRLLASGDNRSQALVKEVVAQANPRTLEMVSEGYVRLDSKRDFSEMDHEVFRVVFASKDAKVIYNAAQMFSNVAASDPRLAVDLARTLDLTVSERATHDLFMWLNHGNTIPAGVTTDDDLRVLVKSLASVAELDDHWIRHFLKRSLKRVPEAVIELVKERLIAVDATSNARPLPFMRKDFDGEGLGLLENLDGAAHLVSLFEWGLRRVDDSGIQYEFGSAVASLCGKYNDSLCDIVLGWMSGGTLDHAKLMATVLTRASNDFVLRRVQFVRDILSAALQIGEDAREQIASALYSAMASGMRGGAAGEPFPEDLALEADASAVLPTLSRFDPAHDLYRDLLALAQENILRQRRRVEAMDAADEESA